MNRAFLLLLSALTVGALPLASQTPSSSATDPAHRPRVIVGWRHFGTPRPPDSQTASNIPQPGAAQASRDQAPNLASDAPADTGQEQSPSSSLDQATGSGQTSDSAPAPGSNVADQPSGQPAADQSSGQPATVSGASDKSAASPAGASGSGDSSTDNSPPPPSTAPEQTAASKVAALSADYAKREQDRDARRQELEAAAHNDPTVQALADIQNTRLMLEGEQDRMQSSGQLAKAFFDLAARLQSDTARAKALLETRRQAAQQSDAEIARINAETPELNLALKNLALLPAGGENDELLRSLAARLDRDDETVRSDRQRSQEARAEVKGLEADQQELLRESEQAKVKAASFAQAAEDAKVNQGLLADRLEFSVQRKRAADELSGTSKILETSVNMHGHLPAGQAQPGDHPQIPAEASAQSSEVVPAQTTGAASQPVESLRDCIRRSGDVAACRAAGGGQP